MQQTIPRLALLDAVLTGLREAPAVALLGARQVGKTTLAEQVARRRGFEFKCTDAPRLTKSMHVVSDTVALEVAA